MGERCNLGEEADREARGGQSKGNFGPFRGRAARGSVPQASPRQLLHPTHILVLLSKVLQLPNTPLILQDDRLRKGTLAS